MHLLVTTAYAVLRVDMSLWDLGFFMSGATASFLAVVRGVDTALGASLKNGYTSIYVHPYVHPFERYRLRSELLHHTMQYIERRARFLEVSSHGTDSGVNIDMAADGGLS